MRIATWNVNSIRQRIEPVMAWLKETQPDIACLQEIKCTDDAFPRLEIEDLGYNVAVVGQKTYNGVAILSKHPLTTELKALPDGDGDDHARYIEGVIEVRAIGAHGDVILCVPHQDPHWSELEDVDDIPARLRST